MPGREHLSGDQTLGRVEAAGPEAGSGSDVQEAVERLTAEPIATRTPTGSAEPLPASAAPVEPRKFLAPCIMPSGRSDNRIFDA